MLGLTGAAKWLAIAGIVSAALGAGYAFKAQYDRGIVAEIAAKQAVAVAADQQEQANRAIAGLNEALATATARADRLATLKGTIHAAPTSKACAASPAFRALLRGMRPAVGGIDRAPALPTGDGMAVPRRT